MKMVLLRGTRRPAWLPFLLFCCLIAPLYLRPAASHAQSLRAFDHAYMAQDTNCSDSNSASVTSFPSGTVTVCLVIRGAFASSDSITAAIYDSSGHLAWQSGAGTATYQFPGYNNALYGGVAFNGLSYAGTMLSASWPDGSYRTDVNINSVVVQQINWSVGTPPPTAIPANTPVAILPTSTPVPPSNTPVPPTLTSVPAKPTFTPTATPSATPPAPPAAACKGKTVETVVRCVEPSVLRVDAKIKAGVAEGTGFVVRSDATGTYVLTNLHVVQGATKDGIVLTTPDGKNTYRALSLATNGAKPLSIGDLAIIRIQPTKLKALSFGNSENIDAGETVVSIGYGLGFDGPPTVTEGIISAIHRNLDDGGGAVWIQHQSTINHGNSGGPLLDLTGAVVGINTLSISQLPAQTGKGLEPVQGIFFAIPANSAKQVVGNLIKAIQTNKLPLAVPTVPPASQTTTYKGDGYQLTLPASWVVKKLSDGTPAFLSSDQEVTLLVSEKSIGSPRTADDDKGYVQKILDTLAKTLGKTTHTTFSPFAVGPLHGMRGLGTATDGSFAIEASAISDNTHLVVTAIVYPGDTPKTDITQAEAIVASVQTTN